MTGKGQGGTSVPIRNDDLEGLEIAELIAIHLQHAAKHTPPESIYALNLEALRAPEITFWTIWKGPDLLGCGALKELDPGHGEIKSMHTAERFRRKGVAASMLKHIIQQARRRSYRRLSLETGSTGGFAAARSLYSKFGFEICGPFADYLENPNSVFMTRELIGGDGIYELGVPRQKMLAPTTETATASARGR
jgi:putative acetyltransferase